MKSGVHQQSLVDALSEANDFVKNIIKTSIGHDDKMPLLDATEFVNNVLNTDK
jgi:hypothetical protein